MPVYFLFNLCQAILVAPLPPVPNGPEVHPIQSSHCFPDSPWSWSLVWAGARGSSQSDYTGLTSNWSILTKIRLHRQWWAVYSSQSHTDCPDINAISGRVRVKTDTHTSMLYYITTHNNTILFNYGIHKTLHHTHATSIHYSTLFNSYTLQSGIQNMWMHPVCKYSNPCTKNRAETSKLTPVCLASPMIVWVNVTTDRVVSLVQPLCVCGCTDRDPELTVLDHTLGLHLASIYPPIECVYQTSPSVYT